VLALPADLHMHPVLRWLIQKGNEKIYGRLLGLSHEELRAQGLAKAMGA